MPRRRAQRGFGTRAIRARDHAAGRPPGRQLGAHLPVGDVRGGRRRRAGRHPSRPATRATHTPARATPPRRRSPTRSRGCTARPRDSRSRRGMAAIHAALRVPAARRRPGRVAPRRVYGSTRTLLSSVLGAVRGGGRVRRRHRRGRGRGGAPTSRPACCIWRPSPTRPSWWPTWRDSGRAWPTGTAPRSSSTTRSPRPTCAGPWSSAPTSWWSRPPSGWVATPTCSRVRSPGAPS